MRQPDYSGQFKRDVKQSQKRGKDNPTLKTLLAVLKTVGLRLSVEQESPAHA